MNTWICSLKDDIEIKDIENYETVLIDDVIFSYTQTAESGEFFITKKLIKKENGQLENIDIEPIKIDLPYSIMYRCKSGKFLYKLQQKEIDFLLDEIIPDDNNSNNAEIDENLRIEGGENIIFYGVPGSGKSHTIKTKYKENEYTFEKLVFHPDYSYSDFVGQIMPVLKDKGVSYDFVPGPFTNVLKKAYNDPSGKYILVIDEINRGNAPAIFGEVFQLLDRDNDGNSDYDINNTDIAKIVYGKNNADKPIKIPSNLWIVATMNTSDQNVFTLDTAFQRRFSMQLIENKFDSSHSYKDNKILDTDVSWQTFCEAINEAITENSGEVSSMEDKRLGVYFVTKNELNDKKLFAYKVLKYLWDDVFKFDKNAFNSDFKTLEAIITHFIDIKNSGKNQFDIFNKEIRDELGV
ncbi:McrB family protein [Campylobacter concisus]|uniref:McrB family protein n=1 Tax=Campylobacter concisus TaxID=199 RepID=UPI000D3C6A30|nr:AAA family ATPase [Campylobacter concisus]